jgi:hypothetical protein
MRTKQFYLWAMMAVLLIGLLPVEVISQQGSRGKGSGQWGPASKYVRLYNPSTVETMSGEIISIDKIYPMSGMYYGLHLMLRTTKETISVHLGPGWYIEKQDIQLQAKDKIEVKGSRIDFNGKPALIAAEVKKGDDVLKLRDENGFPLWSGWRRAGSN